jgi:hypothetical protein
VWVESGRDDRGAQTCADLDGGDANADVDAVDTDVAPRFVLKFADG